LYIGGLEEMKIKRYKTISYEFTFLFSEKEANELLQYANSRREQTQEPLTQILSISIGCRGDQDHVRESVHMNAAIRRIKHGISR
jgi:hypothetical protein